MPGLQAADAAAAGTVEACHTASYYYWGKDPTWALATAVPFGMNERQMNAWMYFGGGNDLLNEFYATQGLYGIACGNTGAQMGGWYRKEINTIDDLKGLKMRIGGLGGMVMTKLGVTPQQIAGGEIYAALERGTIDAAEWIGPYDDEKLGLFKVAKYYYTPGWWEGSAQITSLVNKGAWEGLPKEFREAYETAANEQMTMMLASYDAKNPAALRRLVAGGAEIRAFPREVMDACYKASLETFEDLAAKNPDFKTIYEPWTKFAAGSNEWFRVAEYRLDSARFSAR